MRFGSYCAYFVPLRSVDAATAFATEFIDLIVPPGATPPDEQPVDQRGAITDPTVEPPQVAFSREAYLDNCHDTEPFTARPPPIVLSGVSPTANVTLNLGAGVSVEVEFQDLNGVALDLAGWAVIDLTREIEPIRFSPVGLDLDIRDGRGKALLWEIAERLLPWKRCGDFNQALMELGATVCLPRGAARCEDCPLEVDCGARRSGSVERDRPRDSRA